MTKSYNPNRNPFPRKKLIERYEARTKVHPLQREAKLDYFLRKNPEGYWHDLGAMDVFLDNFGLLFADQFESRRQYDAYLNRLLRFGLRVWELAKPTVLPRKPYWGRHFNIASRKANSGEPRALLRLLPSDDLVRAAQALAYPDSRLDDDRMAAPITPLDDLLDHVSELRMGSELDFERHDDWTADGFVAPDFWPEEPSVSEGPESVDQPTARLGGAILPEDHPKIVDQVRILHPRHATPDLGLRLSPNQRDFKAVVRDQGNLGTCVAHAVSMGLDLLVRRQFPAKNHDRFSPAWLHCATDDRGDTGRSLESVIESVSRRLPCEEGSFPYRPDELGKWRCAKPPWKPSRQQALSSDNLRSDYGLPSVVPIDPDDVSRIKTYLAAGWVVIVTASFPLEFEGQGLDRYGLPPTPLLGQKRADEAHAWLLVGYDHVDGNQQWKYQGRFLAVNSWGAKFPAVPALGPGVCSLPFAYLLTEGLEAYALRFDEKRTSAR